MKRLYFLVAFTFLLFCKDLGFTEETPLILDLSTSINIALQSQKTLGGFYNSLNMATANTLLAESEFNLRVLPTADAGLSGGGRAGDGFTVGAGLDVSKKFCNGTEVRIMPGVMKAAHEYRSNMQFIITQPLLRGFGSEYALSDVYSTRFLSRAALRNLYGAQLQLILRTIQNIYEISKYERMRALDQESLRRIHKFYTTTKLKQKIGVGDPLNIYRAEIELKRAEDSLNQSTDQLNDAKDQLRDLLGLPLNLEFAVQVPLDYHVINTTLEEAAAVAFCNRIEIDQAEDQLKENCRMERIAKKNLRPEVNLVMDYTSCGFGEVFTGAWTGRRENKWGFGLTTNADFNNLGAQIAYNQSVNATKDAEFFIQVAKDNIMMEIKRALRFLNRTIERITLQEEQIHNAHKEYRYAILKFNHGRADNFDIIQAENNLRLAERSLLTAVVDYKIGEYDLLRALGTLADKPEI